MLGTCLLGIWVLCRLLVLCFDFGWIACGLLWVWSWVLVLVLDDFVLAVFMVLDWLDICLLGVTIWLLICLTMRWCLRVLWLYVYVVFIAYVVWGITWLLLFGICCVVAVGVGYRLFKFVIWIICVLGLHFVIVSLDLVIRGFYCLDILLVLVFIGYCFGFVGIRFVLFAWLGGIWLLYCLWVCFLFRLFFASVDFGWSSCVFGWLWVLSFYCSLVGLYNIKLVLLGVVMWFTILLSSSDVALRFWGFIWLLWLLSW